MWFAIGYGVMLGLGIGWTAYQRRRHKIGSIPYMRKELRRIARLIKKGPKL